MATTVPGCIGRGGHFRLTAAGGGAPEYRSLVSTCVLWQVLCSFLRSVGAAVYSFTVFTSFFKVFGLFLDAGQTNNSLVMRKAQRYIAMRHIDLAARSSPPLRKHHPAMYNVVFLCVTYLVPVTAMAVCYGLMGRQLWGDRAIGESTDRQQEAVRSKRKVVRMLVLVVSIFASCWLPYHAYFVYAYHDPAMASSSYAQHLYLCFYWLAMANAGVNPAIYYWMNNRCVFLIFAQVIPK
ncbi:bombesin receptor subtype-3-like [Schistocerca piceifrons]|uniref:bombesin receptor subtype-3-like n=1 Tax=Schistocerca piceifrons TaxID=274613 RepID=UPI001F5E5162|nr:bombesin receptor subtype-3-like [Schistocerca piceifrons]